MTGFNSQSQITVNWQNNGFAKVLSEIKQIEEAAKRLNISGATKKGADGMLKNVKDIKSEQQKLAELESAGIKNEREKRRENHKRLRREYEDNQKKIKEKELSDAKKLEDEKTKILNDAQTKQAFLRKQRATNERKEKLARDLKAIQEDRILTKHQRNIEIAERKKAFAEEERLISSKRFAAAKRMEKGYINKYGVNSIEGINAINRRIEVENALSNKNSLLANANGNVSKAREASDEFNRKQANKLEDAKRLNSISEAELKIGTRRISQHEKDIQNAKATVAYDKIILKQKEQEIHNNKVILKDFKEGSAQYLSIQSKITEGLTESHKIQTRINNGQLQYRDAKEAKRVHQINRDAQFYTRANVAFTAPAMIGAYKTLSDYKNAESVKIMLTAMYGKEKSGAEYDRLLERQLGSSLSLQKLASVSMAALTHKRNEADQGRVVDEKKLESALEKVITIGTINTVDEGRALKQILDIASKGEALPSKDIIPFLNAALGIDFQATYKEMYGKAFKMTTMSSDIFFKVLMKATESKKFNEAWDTFIKSFKQASERLNESTTNLSAAFGGLLDKTLNLKGKVDGASTAFEKIRNWANKRDEKGNPLTSQKVLIGAAVAVAGTLLMGLFNSHKRKAMEFFFKGDDIKYNKRFANSYAESRRAGNGVFASRAIGFKNSLGSVGGAMAGAAGSYLAFNGINDSIAAKTLKDWGIASAEIIGGMTLLFGPGGTVAGIIATLAVATKSFLDSLQNDPNSWWSKLGDFFGEDNYKYERSVGVTRKDPKTGKYIVEGAANFDDPNGRPTDAKHLLDIVEQKAKNKAAGLGDKTDAEVWDAKQKKDNEIRKAKAKADRDAEIAKAKAVKNAEIAKAKEAGEIKASFINAELKNSANAAKYKNETPVYLHNYINNTATSDISVKSDVETKQTGGQSYPSL